MTNVGIAADTLCGVRIEAGETLSFNQLIGRRTKEGGYVAAPEPAYGVGISGTGGGICQVSTALYRAALLGGLDVVERNAAVQPFLQLLYRSVCQRERSFPKQAIHYFGSRRIG